MRAQGGDQIRVLRASSERVAHEDVVDQFLASPTDAAEALGFGDAWGQIHSRCRSLWSGWLRPPVPISDPVGPLRIWVVARRAVAVARTVTASAARRYRA